MKNYVFWLYLAVLCSMCSLASSVSAKAQCDKWLKKVQVIQAKQRMGYSAKKGEKLAKQLTKARDKWWRCKNTNKYAQRYKKKKN